MGKLSAFRQLLYSLSRLPGLSFLRSASSAAYQAERAGQNVKAVKDAAGKLKGEEKKEEEAEVKEEEKAAEETGDRSQAETKTESSEEEKKE